MEFKINFTLILTLNLKKKRKSDIEVVEALKNLVLFMYPLSFVKNIYLQKKRNVSCN